jgi:hypothetical protein
LAEERHGDEHLADLADAGLQPEAEEDFMARAHDANSVRDLIGIR